MEKLRKELHAITHQQTLTAKASQATTSELRKAIQQLEVKVCFCALAFCLTRPRFCCRDTWKFLARFGIQPMLQSNSYVHCSNARILVFTASCLLRPLHRLPPQRETLWLSVSERKHSRMRTKHSGARTRRCKRRLNVSRPQMTKSRKRGSGAQSNFIAKRTSESRCVIVHACMQDWFLCACTRVCLCSCANGGWHCAFAETTAARRNQAAEAGPRPTRADAQR